MQIEIRPSALAHGVTPAEIRCAIAYPVLRVPVASRRFADGRPYLHVGQFDANEPLLEVVGEPYGDIVVVVFHAMLLRWSTVRETGIADRIDTSNIARVQRR